MTTPPSTAMALQARSGASGTEGARMSRAARRGQLLDATKAIVTSNGFHAVSIEAVARQARISRPIVYSHFHDLHGLLEALVDREVARALTQLASVLPGDLGSGDAREILIAALRAYLEAVRCDADTWRLVLMPPEGAPSALRERITQGRAAVVDQLAQAVGSGLVPGRESPDPEMTARTLAAVGDESARLTLTDPERYPAQRMLAHARWTLGLLSSSPQS